MKKKIVLFIIFILSMLAIVSCNKGLIYLENENGDTGSKTRENFEYTHSDDKLVEYNVLYGDYLQYSDGYLYFFNGMSDFINGSSNTLMRYNVKTGNITTVCPDPLCGHNTGDCPFFGTQHTYYLKNNKVSFNRAYLTDKTKPDGYTPIFWLGFVTYDMKANKFTVHRRYNDFDETGGNIMQLYVDNYRYFYDNVHDEKTDTWKTLLTRMNLDTSEILRLSEDDVSFEISGLPDINTKFLFELDSRIYMTDINTIYSTDYEMKNKKVHATGNFAFDVKTDGKYIYYGVKTDMKSAYKIQNVRRMNFDGTDDIDLGIVTAQFQITDKYIYYLTPDEIAIGKSRVSGYGLPEITLYESEVRRCNHDGTNNESVFKFEGDMEYYRFSGYPPIVIGNYIYGLYHYWTDSNGDGVFENDDLYQSGGNGDFNIMRINIQTGEIYYIRVD